MLMSMNCAATKNHAGVCGPCCHRVSCWCQRPRQSPIHFSFFFFEFIQSHSVTAGRVDVCSPCYHWKPWMRMSMVCVVPWIYVDVYGLCCSQKPCGRQWSRLPLTIRGKKAFCCGIDNWSLTVKMRGIEGFSDNPSPLPFHPLKEKQSRPEAFKENA